MPDDGRRRASMADSRQSPTRRSSLARSPSEAPTRTCDREGCGWSRATHPRPRHTNRQTDGRVSRAARRVLRLDLRGECRCHTACAARRVTTPETRRASVALFSDVPDGSETRPADDEARRVKSGVERRVRTHRDLLCRQVELLDELVDHVDARVAMLLKRGLERVQLDRPRTERRRVERRAPPARPTCSWLNLMRARFL
jgi:hypothetical protein